MYSATFSNGSLAELEKTLRMVLFYLHCPFPAYLPKYQSHPERFNPGVQNFQ